MRQQVLEEEQKKEVQQRRCITSSSPITVSMMPCSPAQVPVEVLKVRRFLETTAVLGQAAGESKLFLCQLQISLLVCAFLHFPSCRLIETSF